MSGGSLLRRAAASEQDVSSNKPLLPNKMLRKRSGALGESVASGYSSDCVTLPDASIAASQE